MASPLNRPFPQRIRTNPFAPASGRRIHRRRKRRRRSG
ncbi:hypothetical protein ZEAMMB73_Zm00001d002875 [Zea mays]|uniref:Uncharacterized protein n=1 Tax=Zea mays TaxID=4577 RepID=A0A1D6E4Y0_MAIZE|nr:hypothetical protein ZEAMMB73_Zm00001d002875 [Zea mays]ONM15558.1 hypothetical protein ZEAMMB73_Zm00001d002875 [Zea mays]